MSIFPGQAGPVRLLSLLLTVHWQLIGLASGATHWMVTDDGLRIQASTDSLYNMAQPHDLVGFLRQEEKVRTATTVESTVNGHKATIEWREGIDDPEIEQRIMSSDADCMVAGEQLSKQALMDSYMVLPRDCGILYGKRTDSLLNEARNALKDPASMQQPHCAKFMQLPFSMAAFEHLESMNGREGLTLFAEVSLKDRLLDGWTSLQEFGQALTYALKENPDEWLLYNLAALYWRVESNASEAIECLRRALHITPRDANVMPLLHLGNVLHKASRSKDALIVYQVMLSQNEQSTLAAPHCAFADALVVTLNYTQAVQSYSDCISRESDFPNAQRKRAAVKCHRTLEIALEMQHENLQQTISELRSYEKGLESVKNIHETVLKAVADPETKQQSSLIYDHLTYGPLDHLYCDVQEENQRKYLHCNVDSWMDYKRALDEKHEKLFGLERAQLKAKKRQKGNSSDSVPSSFHDDHSLDEDTVGVGDDDAHLPADKMVVTPLPSVPGPSGEADFFAALQPYAGMVMDEPQMSARYPMMDKEKHFSSEDFKFRSLTWPSKVECEEARPNLIGRDNFPQLFISPENKGYVVSDLLTKYLNLGPGDEHPLPWYPPFCTSSYASDKPMHVPTVDHLPGVVTAGKKDRNSGAAEVGLFDVLSDLTASASSFSDADMGQRINTLMKHEIGPRWLLLNLAALYWRAVGIPMEAVTCLRTALHEQPDKHADLALFQLSHLVVVAGNDRYDDAITLLNKAVEIDKTEPATQYLLGVVRILKQNYTGAHIHMKAALEAYPRFPNALQTMKALRCQMQHPSVKPRATAPRAKVIPEEPNPFKEQVFQKALQSRKTSARMFCLKDNSGALRCFLEEHHFGASVISTKPADKATEQDRAAAHCVQPPRMANFYFPLMQLYSLSKGRKAPAVVNVKMPTKVPKVKEEKDGSLLIMYPDADEQNNNDELPLDWGFKEESTDENQSKSGGNRGVQQPPSKLTVTYKTPPGHKVHASAEEWQQEVVVETTTQNHPIPPHFDPSKITDRKQMLLWDNPLPEVLPTPFNEQVIKGIGLLPNMPDSKEECKKLKQRVNLEQATSTWLSVTAKGVNLEQYIDFNTPVPSMAGLEPVCPDIENNTLKTLDHLNGYQMRDKLHLYKPEKGLKDAFQSLGNDKERLEHVAARLTIAMKGSRIQERTRKGMDGGVHWTLSTVAALYWRVKGDAANSLKCLRHSLNNSPLAMRDLGLVSAANVYHQAGMLHSALIAGGAALQLSPKFVVIHFTLANIYAAMGDLDHAMQFYYSTLSLQSNFEPAKERIRAIYCITKKLPPQASATRTDVH